jgi:hypothetical protein
MRVAPQRFVMWFALTLFIAAEAGSMSWGCGRQALDLVPDVAT